jgi:hypothetical protein
MNSAGYTASTILNPSSELSGLLPIHEADISGSQGKDFEGKYLHVHTEYNSLNLFWLYSRYPGSVGHWSVCLWSLICRAHPF